MNFIDSAMRYCPLASGEARKNLSPERAICYVRLPFFLFYPHFKKKTGVCRRKKWVL